MANDSISVTGNASYNYAYTKPAEAEQKKKADSSFVQSEAKPKEVESNKNPTVKNSEGTQESKSTTGTKSIYQERLEAEKKAEEDKEKQRQEQQREEYLQELTTQLNKRMNNFSENIKFGINDKSDSIVVSVVEQNSEKKIKELSKEDADKLFRRLDYVLGVLFDNKA